MGSPRAVILYFNGTFVNRENGAHVRVSELLRYLVATFPSVFVYSYRNHPTCPWKAADIARFADDFPGVELVLDTFDRHLRLWSRLKYLASMVAPGLAGRLIRRQRGGTGPALAALRARAADPVYVVNYAKGMVELNGVPEGDVVVETHDLSFLNAMKQQGGRLTDLKSMLKARSEFVLLGAASDLVAIAPPEAELFRMLLPDQRTFFVPSYGGAAASAESSREVETPRYDLLFVGSDNPLNVRGICDFMAAHAPWLRTRTLAIAGRVCSLPQVQSAAATVGAVLLGFVDEIAPLYQSARIVVSPVDGTGLKIKVVEALAAGKPVFASQSTLAGLPAGHGACAFPIDEQAMDALIADGEARHAAGAAALTYAASLTDRGDLAALTARLAHVRVSSDREPSPAI